MNCNCIRETTEKLRPVVEAQPVNPRKGKVRLVECAGVGLNFKTGKVMLGLPFNIHFEKQRKSDSVLIYADFCPFCGKSTKPEEPNPGT